MTSEWFLLCPAAHTRAGGRGAPLLGQHLSWAWAQETDLDGLGPIPVQHDRTKHVEIDRFFIKEKLDAGIISLTHVSSGKQFADCLTKGLGTKDCNLACDKMGMIDIYHPS